MMPGSLAELAADFLDDVARRLADRADGQRAEEEDQHRAEEAADEDLDVRPGRPGTLSADAR